jgi:GntR family transcriptional regulator / MocR family aminotransferase
MVLELDGKGELYGQLLRGLKRAILDGRLPPGTRLPSTRDLATELGMARNTVLAAYELLCAEQLAVARVGAGTFVADTLPGARRARTAAGVDAQTRYASRLRTLPPLSLGRRNEKLRLDLQYGEPLVDMSLFTVWRRALSHAAQHTEARGVGAQGLAALRHEIAAHLGPRRGIPCDPDDVIVLNGTQQAMTLLARVLLNEQDTVVLEDPHYQLAKQCFQAHGAQVVHVPVDAAGLDAARLPAQRLKLVVVTPSHQFPSGHVLSVPRRLALLRAASERRFWVLEDDYDGEFSFDSLKLPALRSLDREDRVIYVGSFSKTLLPSIRLGFVVCPQGIKQEMVRAKMLADLGCSAIEQNAVAHLMSTGAYDRHLRRSSAELKRRRRALLQGLKAHCGHALQVEDSGGGMHLVTWLPGCSEVRFKALIDLATERGLGLHTIAPHYARPPRVPGLLMGFASLSVAQINAATRLLGQCLAEVAAHRLHQRRSPST